MFVQMVGVSGMGLVCVFLTKNDLWRLINTVPLVSFFAGKELTLLSAGLNKTINNYGIPFWNRFTDLRLTSNGGSVPFVEVRALICG